jgi:hypothetical protein
VKPPVLVSVNAAVAVADSKMVWVPSPFITTLAKLELPAAIVDDTAPKKDTVPPEEVKVPSLSKLPSTENKPLPLPISTPFGLTNTLPLTESAGSLVSRFTEVVD